MTSYLKAVAQSFLQTLLPLVVVALFLLWW
jgi:hypothetical protein